MSTEKFNIPDYIQYKKNSLQLQNHSFENLVDKYRTPCVCVSLDRIEKNITDLQLILDKEYFNYKIFYALKASYFKPILNKIRGLRSIGIEVLSNLEVNIAELAGFKNEDIIFNGIGRKGEDLCKALKDGLIVNIDSINELKEVIEWKGGVSDFSVGFRVHPEFDGDGNFVSKESKLGMTYKDAVRCIRLALSNNIKVNGISFHIFSNIKDSKNYSLAVKSVVDFMNSVSSKFSIKFDYLDVGGGLNSPMFLDKDFLKKIVKETSRSLKRYKFNQLSLYFELGRYIVADATVVLSRVKAIKNKNNKKWAVLDIGTNYLIPAPGFNFKVVATKLKNNKVKYSFVDGICSPAGFIDEGYVDKIKSDDVVLILNSGAYTSVMKEEFVYASPVHIFFEKNKIIKVYPKKNLKQVLDFHYWK